MISYLISAFLCFPLLSLAIFMILTSSESRIRFNNRLSGWNLDVVSFPFDTTFPAYKLHGSGDNP